MKLFHSLAFAAVAALGASAASLSPSMAQANYPSGTVTFLVPYAAGANGDIVSRIVADDLQKQLGQPVVIDNRPGAGGNIGAQRGKAQKPDGYTIMLATNTHTINQNLYPDAGFDLLTDFEPVSLITTTYQLLLVNPKLPIKTAPEFVEYAKSHDLNLSSGGNGSSGHLFMEQFALKTGIKVTHIPYDGVAAGLVDLMEGRVDATFRSISSVLEMVRTNELRALAIAAPQRSPLLPDVPTLKEVGIDGMEAGTWQGIVVPAKTPKDVIDTLNKAIAKSLATPAVKDKLAQQGVDPSPSTPEEFRTLIADDLKRWHDVITGANIKID